MDITHCTGWPAESSVLSKAVAEKDSQLSIRLSSAVHQALREYAERLGADTGLPVTPSVAARKLLIAALEAEGFDFGKLPAKPRKRS